MTTVHAAGSASFSPTLFTSTSSTKDSNICDLSVSPISAQPCYISKSLLLPFLLFLNALHSLGICLSGQSIPWTRTRTWVQILQTHVKDRRHNVSIILVLPWQNGRHKQEDPRSSWVGSFSALSKKSPSSHLKQSGRWGQHPKLFSDLPKRMVTSAHINISYPCLKHTKYTFHTKKEFKKTFKYPPQRVWAPESKRCSRSAPGTGPRGAGQSTCGLWWRSALLQVSFSVVTLLYLVTALLIDILAQVFIFNLMSVGSFCNSRHALLLEASVQCARVRAEGRSRQRAPPWHLK